MLILFCFVCLCYVNSTKFTSCKIVTHEFDVIFLLFYRYFLIIFENSVISQQHIIIVHQQMCCPACYVS